MLGVSSWDTFGTAWSTLNNSNASLGGKAFAAGYMSVWGGSHVALGVGLGGLACADTGVPVWQQCKVR